MSKREIDEWLHKWHDRGDINVDFESDTYESMLEDMEKAGVKNPFDLMVLILSVLS